MASLLIKAKKSGSSSRSVVIVGRTVAKKAVVRNLLKRRIRAILRQIPKKQKTEAGYLIIVKPEAARSSYQKLKEEINNSLIRSLKKNND